ncbi:MAG: cell wall hydrolase [Alphaproteobacteria bacterium]|nr:cell wall hydrolase [Alphaproteobacteria bacterium]
MNFSVIESQSETMALAYRIARVVYAETYARSLRVVEALTSMISNCARKNNRDICDVVSDATIFESLNTDSMRHMEMNIDSNRREFQMCVRIAVRMLHGHLPDMCRGATMFHRAELLPDWAIARGYVADIDGILFYA